MSNYLCNLDTGAQIAFQGHSAIYFASARARHRIHCDRNRIAPLRSMLHWLLAEPDRHQERQFWLLFGARREQDIYYREEFETLAAKHANFHFLPTLSRPEATGTAGEVRSEHLPEIVGNRTICTPTSAAWPRWSKRTETS